MANSESNKNMLAFIGVVPLGILVMLVPFILLLKILEFFGIIKILVHF